MFQKKWETLPPTSSPAQTWWTVSTFPRLRDLSIYLLEGFIRPANWVYNPDPRKCDIPTFGSFFLGLEIGREDKFPEWAARDLS
jgi:hypothetical protein